MNRYVDWKNIISGLVGAVLATVGTYFIALPSRAIDSGWTIVTLGGVKQSDFDASKRFQFGGMFTEESASKARSPNPANNGKPGCPNDFEEKRVAGFVKTIENGVPTDAVLIACLHE